MNYKNKYLKYKNKYLKLRIKGGSTYSNNLDNFLKLVRNRGIANKDKKFNIEESTAYNLLTPEEKNEYHSMTISQIYGKSRNLFKPQYTIVPPKVPSQVSSQVSSQVPSKVLSEVPSKVLSEVLPKVPSEISSEIQKVPSEISSEIQKIIPSKINTQIFLSEFEIPNDTEFLSYIQCYHNITIKTKYNICRDFYVWCKEKYTAYNDLPFNINGYIKHLLYIKNNEISQYHYNNFITFLSDHIPVVYFENNTIYFSFNVQTDDFDKFDQNKYYLYNTIEKIKFYYYIKALNICELILTNIRKLKKDQNLNNVPYQIIITLQECMCPLYKILANILPIILNVPIMHKSFVFQNIEKQDYICSTYNKYDTYKIVEHYKNEDIIDDYGFLRDSKYYVDVDGGFANFTTYTQCESVKPMFLFDKDVNPTKINKTIQHTGEQLKGTLIRSCRSCIFTIRTNDKTITVINVHLNKTFAKADLIMMIDNKAQYNLEKQHADIIDSTLTGYYDNFTTTYNDIIDRQSVLVIMGDYNITYDENILVKYNILYKLHSTTLNLDWILYFEPISELDQHEEITIEQITTKKKSRNTSYKKQLKQITPIIELHIQSIKDKLIQINLLKSQLKKKQKELIKVKTNYNNNLKALEGLQTKIPYRRLDNTLYDNYIQLYKFLYDDYENNNRTLVQMLKTQKRYKKDKDSYTKNQSYIDDKERLDYFKTQYDAYNRLYKNANEILTKLLDEQTIVKQDITHLEDLQRIINVEIETIKEELTNHLSQLILLKEELMEKLKLMENMNTKKYTNSLIKFKLNIKLNNIKEDISQIEKELTELQDTINTTLTQSQKDKETLLKAKSAFSRILEKYKSIPTESQNILNQYKDAIEQGEVPSVRQKLIDTGNNNLILNLYIFANVFEYNRDLKICIYDDKINTTKIDELNNRKRELLNLHEKLNIQLQLIHENLENKTMNTEDLRDDETMNTKNLRDDETINIEDIILDDETMNIEDIIQADKDN